MELIAANKISKSYEGKVLFEDASFTILKDDRIGLLGKNGGGKTTLLNVLLEDLPIDSGNITKLKELNVHYLRQNPELDKSVEDYLKENGDYSNTNLLYKYAKQMNLPLKLLQRNMSELSGGERTKIALLKLFMSGSEFIVLDEPTNHLDLAGIDFLTDWLIDSFKGTFIVVSHNRDFLSKVTNKIIDIDNKTISQFDMNYSKYVEYKENQLRKNMERYEKSQKEIHRLKESTNTKKMWLQQIDAKIHRIKMDKADDALRNKLGGMKISQKKISAQIKNINIRAQQSEVDKPYIDTDKINMKLLDLEKSYNEVLTIIDLKKAINNETLFENVNLTIHRGEKIILVGDNGSGKTTLVNLICGKLTTDNGTVEVGKNVKIGILEQVTNKYDSEEILIDYMSKKYAIVDPEQIKDYLAKFLFRDQQIYKPLNTMSGGERIKLQILENILSACNFIILDEPTNNLDIDSIISLENALAAYPGTLLVITHDRELIRKVATTILKIENKKIFGINPDKI